MRSRAVTPFVLVLLVSLSSAAFGGGREAARRVREGMAHFQAGDYEKAAEAFAEADVALPEDAWIGFDRACVDAAQGDTEKAGEGESWEGSFEPSLDVFQRVGSNTTAMVTVNTDFAETEVDTRKTNLTRFALFFPEKRTFFLEGSDIFDFGVGMSSPYHSDIVPFFSRRIGLFEGEAVPLRAGGKISGKAGNTNFGGLVTRTGDVDGLTPATTMGASTPFRPRLGMAAPSAAVARMEPQ